MAPRKEKSKVDKASDVDGADMILSYLKHQNRPYSATDISANLHNKVTKTQAVKLLKELHDKQMISGKAAGKQLVYHALQDTSSESVSPARLDSLEASIGEIRERLPGLHAEEKMLKARVTALNATKSTSELELAIEEASRRKAELLDRLTPLREGTVMRVSTEQRDQAEAERKTWEKRAIVRRKICKELWGIVKDTKPAGLSFEEFWEELGLDCEVL